MNPLFLRSKWEFKVAKSKSMLCPSGKIAAGFVSSWYNGKKEAQPSAHHFQTDCAALFHSLHRQTQVTYSDHSVLLLRTPMACLPMSSAPIWPAVVCSTTLRCSRLRFMCKGQCIVANLPEEHPTASEFWQSWFSDLEINLLSWHLRPWRC